MADQNQRISDLLDTLTDASSETIETALRIYEPADVAAVVAERALAGGGGVGGSSAPNNLAVINVNNAPTLNTGNTWAWTALEADLAIARQTGSDFSIQTGGEEGANGAVLSASGGWFQWGCYFGPPGGVTLDGGSTLPRWLALGAIGGVSRITDPDNSFSSFGIDLYVPVQAAASGLPALTVPGLPVHVLPGGPVLTQITFQLVNATGTDVVTQPLNGFSDFAIWQIPALT